MRYTRMLLRILSAVAMCVCLILPANAASPFQAHTSSDQLIAIIKAHEGFVAYPMTDATGTYIGYGSLYSDAVALFGPGCEPITEEQAAQLTRRQLDAIDTALNSFLEENNVIVNQNQYDALADFTYGVGIGWTTFKNTDGTWCKLKIMLLADPSTWTAETVQDAFGAWVYAGGVKLDGLVRVRAMEAELFLTPVSEEPSGTEPVPEPDPDPDPEPQPQPEPVFSDVHVSDWFYDSVMAAKELGLMNGDSNETFSPRRSLTRAELVMTLANFEKVDLSAYTATNFSDVPNTWYTAAVAWASSMGYVNGYADGTFRPSIPVTRDQICCILARFLRAHSVRATAPGIRFIDEAEIGSYATADVAYCASLGIVTGRSDGSFGPRDSATRAEAATMLVRMAAVMS